MIKKNTILIPSNKCGVWLVRTFHLYKGFNRKTSYLGDFIKVSVRKTKPSNWIKKKTKLKGIIVRTKKYFNKNDGSILKFKYNTLILLKKRTTPLGKRIFGPSVRNIFRTKLLRSLAGSI